MDQALVSLGVLLEDSSEHDLPGSFLFQLFHILLDELVFIDKISVLLSHGIYQKTALLANSRHCVKAQLDTLGSAS